MADTSTLEQTVLAALSGDDAASEYCVSIKDTPDAAQTAINLFTASKDPGVQFFGLQLLEAAIQAGHPLIQEPAFRHILRTFLLSPWEPAAYPMYVRNKAAQVLVLLFANDFPEQWPSFFDDLLGLSGSAEAVVDLFLRVMEQIDTEIISRQYHFSEEDVSKSIQIKDALRDNSVDGLIDAFHQIFSTMAETHPHLVEYGLRILGPYVDWIDIGYVVSDRFVALLHSFLGNKNFRVEVADLLFSIASKGMGIGDKVDVILRLQMADIVRAGAEELSSNDSTLDDENEASFFASLASLGGQVCQELLSSVDSMVAKGEVSDEEATPEGQLLSSLLDSSVAYVRAKENSVGFRLRTMLAKYASFLYKKRFSYCIASSITEEERIRLLISSMMEKLRIPSIESLESEGEDEFQEYRDAMVPILRNFAKLDHVFVARLLKTATNQLNSDTYVPEDVENILYLFYELSEGVSKMRSDDIHGLFEDILAIVLHKQSLSGGFLHLHPSVSIRFFQILQRYCRVFARNDDALHGALELFLGDFGLLSSHPFIQQRVSYLLLKFIRPLRNSLSQHVPFITVRLERALCEDMIPLTLGVPPGGLQGLTVGDSTTYEENIYEILGLLCGSPYCETSIVKNVVEGLTGTIMRMMEERVWLQDVDGDMTYTRRLGSLIAAIGHMSKGIRDQSMSELFLPIFEGIIGAFGTCHNVRFVRDRIMAFFHEMLKLLGAPATERLTAVIELLNLNYDQEALNVSVDLVLQMISSFRDAVSHIALPLVALIVRNLHAGMPDFLSVASPAEIGSENIQVFRAVVGLVFNVVTLYGFLPLLQTFGDCQDFNDVLLDTLLVAVRQPFEMKAASSSLRIWQKFIAEVTEETFPGFRDYVCANLLPALLSIPFSAGFSMNDPECISVMTELHFLLRLIVGEEGHRDSELGPAAREHLSSTLLPELFQVASSTAEDMIHRISMSDRAALVELYHGCVG
eukprot:TRINITY_DN2035_c1_g1_i1.p1 TRINITY_DN2035_c1_g1~~TRINITY_DN2035_c1_g1_i1.p1  ORF type:complete len:973 (+),score=239.76 TRINITY_DN2035_c1_g1_i1:113-3031(+)